MYPWEYMDDLLMLQCSCLDEARHDGRFGVLSTRGGTHSLLFLHCAFIGTSTF